MPLPKIDERPLPETLTIEHWSDPLVEEHGHRMDSWYVETFWLPVMGPTPLWAARRLAAYVESAGGGDLPTAAFARELGLGKAPTMRVTDPLPRAVTRLRLFGVARLDGHTLTVRTHLGPLNQFQARRLPPHLAAVLQLEGIPA